MRLSFYSNMKGVKCTLFTKTVPFTTRTVEILVGLQGLVKQVNTITLAAAKINSMKKSYTPNTNSTAKWYIESLIRINKLKLDDKGLEITATKVGRYAEVKVTKGTTDKGFHYVHSRSQADRIFKELLLK